jgi:nucleoside-diphosphate-sugar epimerase
MKQVMEKVLLTGVNGYIGKGIFKFLLSDNDYDLYVLSRDCSNMNYEKCINLNNVDSVSFDYIINCIGETKNSNLMNYVNNDFCKELFKKLNLIGVKKFIHFSTVSVYDQSVSGLINRDGNIFLNSVYAKTKFEFDKFLLSQISLLDKIIILRPSNVIFSEVPTNSISRLSKFGIKFFSFRMRYINWVSLDFICQNLTTLMQSKNTENVYILNHYETLSDFYHHYYKRTYFIYIPVEFIEITISILNLKRQIQKFHQLFSLYYFK